MTLVPKEQLEGVDKIEDGIKSSKASQLRRILYYVLPFLLFILYLTLVSPEFFPNLFNINPHDEASYINNGRELANGNLIVFAASPLSSFLYAPIYLLVQKSPFWLLHSAILGRFVLVGLLWLSAYLIARRISEFAHPLIMIGFIFITPVLTGIVHNPSDALFATMSGFGFWQFLGYLQKKTLHHLWLASLFVGLASLARSDGLVLFAIFFVLSLYFSLPQKKVLKQLVSSSLPFIFLIGGYVLVYGLMTGRFELGTVKRSYAAFEQGHKTIYSGEGSGWVEGAIEAQSIFGTAEENRYSIINAIKRNPSAFLDRLEQTIKDLPEQIINVYNKRIAAVLFLLALLGILNLMKSKCYALLAVFFLWSATPIVYLATFFRDGYLLHHYFVVFALASVGLSELMTNVGKKRQSIGISVLLLGLVILSILTNKPAFMMGLWLFLLGFLIIWIAKMSYPRLGGLKVIGLLTFLCIGLVIRSEFKFPNYPSIGEYQDEKALVYMTKTLDTDSRLGTYAPLNAWAAKMTPVIMGAELRSLETSQDLIKWIHEEKLQAIYIEGALRSSEPTLWALIKGEISKSLELGFSTGEDGIQVLLVNVAHDSNGK